MKKIITCLIIACSVFTLNAKSWKIIGKVLEADTTVLVQDAGNPSLYKYVGRLTNKSFKVFDGVDNYIPTCGLNDPFDQQVGMEKQVDESQSGFRVSYVNPNNLYRITLTDGTAPKIIVEKVVPYDHMYLIGGPVNTHDPNWLLGDARELDKDPANPFIFYYRGFLKYNTFGDERGSIKFLTSNTSWDPGFHPVGTSNVALAQAAKMRLGGSDTKWEIPADGSGNGYYVIKLNTLDETISVVQFEHANVDYPNNIYITGDAMPCGWVNGAPEIMTPSNIMEGKYSWTGNLVPGQFKFLKTKGTWGSCYVSTVKDQPIEYGKQFPVVYELDYISNGGNDYKFVATEAARCNIKLDLVTMKILVQKETENSIQNIKMNDDITISAGSGKITVKSSSSSKKKISIFTIDGRKIYNESFVYNSEISLSKGYYFVEITD
ncbi:MAG TPA: SusF/SusE family outer membrane protein, partial [Paludibacter sp.]